MKSQKRSHSERAFARGYRAAVTGKSRTLCPHVNGDARQEWLTGVAGRARRPLEWIQHTGASPEAAKYVTVSPRGVTSATGQIPAEDIGSLLRA